MAHPTPQSLAHSGSEHAEQVALFAWAALQFVMHPELRLMFAIPNGGKRDKITAARLKAEGVKAGVPDIFLPVPRGRWHGLFIELKKTGGKATGEQNTMLAGLEAQGFGACVCVGWQRASKVILQYLQFSG